MEWLFLMSKWIITVYLGMDKGKIPWYDIT